MRAPRFVSACVALLAASVGVAAPASAAATSPDTVTVSYLPASMTYVITPTTVTAAVGDWFTLANTLTSGDGSPLYYVSLVNASGVLSRDGTTCTNVSDCTVEDLSDGSATSVFAIDQLGTVNVVRVLNGDPQTIGTLTLSGADSGAAPDPALVYPTAYFNANGGACSGSLELTRRNGENEVVTAPTSSSCSREGYRLQGWAREATARTTSFGPGSPVPIGDESFTLYAVWAPLGAEITYDANVGDDVTCVDATGAAVPPGPGRVRTELTTSGLSVVPPCAPDNANLLLAGWAASGDGPVVYRLGQSLSDAGIAAGSILHVYAVWQPQISIPCPQGRAAPLWTISCTDFGAVPVGWRAVLEVRLTNQSRRAHALVVQPLPHVATNGTPVLDAPPGGCGAGGTVPPLSSCTFHVTWTPARAGPLDPQVPLVVCDVANATQCYRTAAAQGLRGTAY